MNDTLPFPVASSETAATPLADEIEKNLYPKEEDLPPRVPPKIVFKGGERSKTIPLQFPLTVDGVSYDAVEIRRLTAGEVASFMDTLRALPAGETRRFPMYFDERGVAIPDDVWTALDDDDVEMLQNEVGAFLPKRFRQEPSATAIPSPTSSSTQAESDTSASS